MTTEQWDKIKRLSRVLCSQRFAWYTAEYPESTLGVSATLVTLKCGKKYTKVDVGRAGCYMVVNDTGEIFGIKAYGVIHRGHYYGTLDEIDNWNWGAYRATPKPHPETRAAIQASVEGHQ